MPTQQLIVGLEDPPPPAVVLKGPDDRRFDLREKFAVLNKSDYKPVLEFIEPLVRSAVSYLGKTLF